MKVYAFLTLIMSLFFLSCQSIQNRSAVTRIPNQEEAVSRQNPPTAALKATEEEVQTILATWPQISREAAATMLEKYGLPADASPIMMMWFDNGPWARTVVVQRSTTHYFPVPHVDVLQQVIAMEVPVEKIDDLSRFNESVYVERSRNEVSIRCATEEMNLIAVNLIKEIIAERITVDQARANFQKTAQHFDINHPGEEKQSARSVLPPRDDVIAIERGRIARQPKK